MEARSQKVRFGFTLIELMVVLSIIGLLASIILASVNTARAKARDARRLEDIKQIQNALEFFYDKYGKYPNSNNGSLGCVGSPPAPSPTPSYCNSTKNNPVWIRNVAGAPGDPVDISEFMTLVPKDPVNNATTQLSATSPTDQYAYWYVSYNLLPMNNKGYALLFRLEDGGDAREQAISQDIKVTNCTTNLTWSLVRAIVVGVSAC